MERVETSPGAEAETGRRRSKLTYRIKEAEQDTGISRSRLYEMLASGELESVQVGRSRLIIADSLRKRLGLSTEAG